MIVGVAACGTPDEPEDEVKGTLQIGMAPWVNSPPPAYLSKIIIEENLDWEVEIVEADIGMIFTDVAAGGLDYSLDAALPYYHAAYKDEYEDDLVILGEDNPIYHLPAGSFVVPDYVTIDTIAEMADHVDEFDGEIIGIEPGAGIMEQADEAMEIYGLEEFTLVESSDYGMTTALGDAIEAEEWIVVTGWEPHWKFFQWELKYLEDPEGAFGGDGYHTPILREGLEEDAPEVVEFLKNMYLDLEDLNAMIMEDTIEDRPTEEVVREWMEENPDTVEEWLP